MAVTLTSIRLDTKLADEAVRVLGAKSRTEAVHMALKEIVRLKGFKSLMTKYGGKARSPEAMSGLIVFDTSVIVDQIRTNLHLDRLANVDGLIRNSSVVLAELWRGASSSIDSRIVEAMEQSHPILTPSTNDWHESGLILAKMRVDRGFEPHKLRDLHFDVLIALTARAHGARLITSEPRRLRADPQVPQFQTRSLVNQPSRHARNQTGAISKTNRPLPFGNRPDS